MYYICSITPSKVRPLEVHCEKKQSKKPLESAPFYDNKIKQ